MNVFPGEAKNFGATETRAERQLEDGKVPRRGAGEKAPEALEGGDRKIGTGLEEFLHGYIIF